MTIVALRTVLSKNAHSVYCNSTNGNLSFVTFDDMIVVQIIILTAYLKPDSMLSYICNILSLSIFLSLSLSLNEKP